MVATGGELLAQYRPLRTLGYALQFAVFGGNAWGFHLGSLVLHAIAAWLVGCLAQAVFGGGRWLAATAWLLHPAVSENAMHLAAQGNLLCLILSLLALLAHLRWLDTGRRRLRAASLGCFFLALATSEFAAVLPLLLIVVEIVRGDWKRSATGAAVRRHLPFWIVLGALLVLRFAVAAPMPHHDWWEGSCGSPRCSASSGCGSRAGA
jgi:hypothetical protein